MEAQLGWEGKTDLLYIFEELFLYHCSALLQLYEKDVILILEVGKERLREVKGKPKVTLVIQRPEPRPPDSGACTCVSCMGGRTTWMGCWGGGGRQWEAEFPLWIASWGWDLLSLKGLAKGSRTRQVPRRTMQAHCEGLWWQSYRTKASQSKQKQKRRPQIRSWGQTLLDLCPPDTVLPQGRSHPSLRSQPAVSWVFV